MKGMEHEIWDFEILTAVTVKVTLPGYGAMYVIEVCRVSKERAASSSGYFTALKIEEAHFSETSVNL
jgi:hypothetical protein